MVGVAHDHVGSPYPLAERPRLRPVETFPTRHLGQRGLVLRDPSDRDLAPLFLSEDAVRALEGLNGRRTVGELAANLALRGIPINQAQLRTLLIRVDEAGYLEGPRAE